MVTIRDIAARAGVSRGTVDRVLNGRPGVNPETEASIRAWMDALGYRPNLAGKMLAARKKHLRLAFLVVQGPEFVFFADVLRGGREKAAELQALGVTVDFYLIRQFDRPYLESLLQQVEDSRPDGIAVLPLRAPPFLAFLERMHLRQIPTVFFNVDEPSAQRLCYVGCDYVQAGRVAAGLASLCTGGVGVVGVATSGGADIYSFATRMRGFTQELSARYPHMSLADRGKPTLFQGHDFGQVANLLERHPELKALYLVNLGDYSVCRAVYEAAQGRGLAVITNDLVPAQRDMLAEGIISATITQQPELQGAQSLQVLYDHMVLGRSCAPRQYTQLGIHLRQNT